MSSPECSTPEAKAALTGRPAAFPRVATAFSGLVFNIQRFSVQDGPGIRTTVFLKGCPLRCAWCHNPESQSFQPELLVPPCSPPETVGRHRSVDELIALAERDRHYYETSGGGLTVSGGEPLAQPHFALALLRAARGCGLHTVLDTCGFAPPDLFAEALALSDLVLFDLKETDPERHRLWTGAPLDPILRNLRLAAEGAVEVWLRLPVVPSLNDRDDHWQGVAEILAGLPRRLPVHLLPYHALGVGKLRSLGRVEPLLEGAHEPSQACLRQIAGILAAAGSVVHLPEDELIEPAQAVSHDAFPATESSPATVALR